MNACFDLSSSEFSHSSALGSRSDAMAPTVRNNTAKERPSFGGWKRRGPQLGAKRCGRSEQGKLKLRADRRRPAVIRLRQVTQFATQAGTALREQRRVRPGLITDSATWGGWALESAVGTHHKLDTGLPAGQVCLCASFV